MTPGDLVRQAVDLRLPAIAITDHDTVAGTAEALAAAEGSPLIVISGVELSAELEDRGIHILGYHIDHTDPELLAELASLQAMRVRRAGRIVRALAADGYSITLDDVLASADGGSVGRAHIAQLLVGAGRASSTKDAFTRLLGDSAPYYVPKVVRTPAAVIGLVHRAGGVAVLAHPGLSGVDDLIPGLVADGISGIEAYHGSHDAPTRERYERLAASLGLVVTGGSDYHGEHREGEIMGTARVPLTVLATLETARQTRMSTR